MSRPLSSVYADVPAIACQGYCIRACGPIACSGVEAEALQDQGIPLPGVMDHLITGPLTCSHLNAIGRCNIYAHRPLVCRLFGVVPEMPCIYGCKVTGNALTSQEGKALANELEEASLARGLKMHLPIH